MCTRKSTHEVATPARASTQSYHRMRNGSRVRRVETKMHIAIATENNELRKNAPCAGGR